MWKLAPWLAVSLLARAVPTLYADELPEVPREESCEARLAASVRGRARLASVVQRQAAKIRRLEAELRALRGLSSSGPAGGSGDPAAGAALSVAQPAEERALAANCGLVWLKDQEEVDDFLSRDCPVVNILRVTGSSKDLTGIGLKGPIEVLWHVQIQYTSQLLSLAGLENITCTGTLAIRYNKKLESLRGLRLSSVRELEIRENKPLRSFEGLEHITEIRGEFMVNNNPALQSLKGLDNLAKVHGRTMVWNHKKLTSISALRSLTEAWGGLSILDNPALKSLQGLNRLRVAEVLSIKDNDDLQVFGGLLSDSSNIYIGRLVVDTNSWPKCVSPQERHHLAVSLNSKLAKSAKATRDQWKRNSCGPEALRCWVGLPCLVNLTGSDFMGEVFLTDRSCGPCDSSRSTASMAADAMADLTPLVTGLGAGDYSVCRCRNGDLGAGPVAHLSLSGPRLDHSFQCIRGHECSLNIKDHGLASGSSVAVMDHCGAPEVPGGRAVKGAVGDYLITDRRAFASVQPNLYALCWTPPCSIANGSVCPQVQVGDLRVKGAFVRDEDPVAVGGALVVANIGDSVRYKDRLLLLPECGQPGWDAPAVEPSNDSMLFSMTMNPSHFRAQQYRKCWCQPLRPSVPCNASEHFLADAGSVQVLCPAEHEPTATGECRACPVGREREAAGLEMCTLRPGYISKLAAYAAILCLAFTSILVAIGRPARIEDVSTIGGRTIIKTHHPHRCYMYGRASFAIRFRGTAHPGLDTPREPMRACTNSPQTLEVLTLNGCPVKERLDTSQGFVELPLHQALWHRSWPMPSVLAAPLLVLGALVLLLTEEQQSPRDVAVSTAAAFLGAAAIRLIVALWPQVSPLDRRIEEFRKVLLETNPRPTACERGPDRAVELGELFRALEFFRAFIRDRTAYYMDGNIFGPLTKVKRLSYAELVGPKKVEWFVSHFWGGQFQHFCSSLRKHAESVCGPDAWKRSTYWICFLSNNQYRLTEELGSSVMESSFFLALQYRSNHGVCMVLDDLAMPLTRSWCIFELCETLRLERSTEGFRGLLLCTTGGVLNLGQGSVEVAMNLAERIATLDLEKAQASCAKDKEMINAQVIKELGSFEAMNRLVRHKMHDILLKAHEHANDSFGRLFALLNSRMSTIGGADPGGEGAADAEGCDANDGSAGQWGLLPDGLKVQL